MNSFSQLRPRHFLFLLVLLLLVVCLEWFRQTEVTDVSTVTRASSYLVWIALTSVAWTATWCVRPVIGWSIAGAVAGGFWAYHVGSWIDAFQTFVEGELWPVALYTAGPALGTITGAGFGAMLSRGNDPAVSEAEKSESFAGSLAALMSAMLLFCTTVLVLLLSAFSATAQQPLAKAVGVREDNIDAATGPETFTGERPESTQGESAEPLEGPGAADGSPQLVEHGYALVHFLIDETVEPDETRDEQQVVLRLTSAGEVDWPAEDRTFSLELKMEPEGDSALEERIREFPSLIIEVQPETSLEQLRWVIRSARLLGVTKVAVRRQTPAPETQQSSAG